MIVDAVPPVGWIPVLNGDAEKIRSYFHRNTCERVSNLTQQPKWEAGVRATVTALTILAKWLCYVATDQRN